MPKIKELIGDVLQGKSGSIDVDSIMTAGKIVGLYFSAHWCPPCRGFTPTLATFYNNVKSKKNFEIIFISSDKDESSFKEYLDSMPWPALPFSDRDRKKALSEKFGVTGIPTLILLDEDGKVLNKNARGDVLDDPEGEDFPWKN
ncbi:tryparedoxin-like [Gigantopelta aegis]|uniref:tryparedoxin-like n=1 Tax=Gigantopelta aegis TaxID=1735272 RepID=UPI001B88C08B|nr:tryparedoxin-like [Gigantopelta aegis]